MSERTTETHPSFGMIGINRQTCTPGAKLFASPLLHPQIISLTIRKCEVDRNLSKYWFHGGEEIIEVLMSENQFAEFVCGMNVGDGVPCTIAHVNGEQMGKPPLDEERKKFEVELREHVESISNDLAALLKKAKAVLDMPGPVKSPDKKEMLELIRRAHQQANSNLPFILQQLRERMEKVVTSAKNDFEAFVAHHMRQTGAHAITQETPSSAPGGLLDAPDQVAKGKD